MTHLSRSRLMILAMSAVAAPSWAQNAFRPLPAVPDAEWNSAGAGAAARIAPSYLEQLERAAELPRSEHFVEVRGFADAQGAANLEGGGDVSMQHGGWSAMLGTELDGELLGALSVSTEAFFYNFGGAGTLALGDDEPFNDLYRTRVAGAVRTPSSDGIGWFSGFELAFSGEDEAPTNESMSVGGLGGVRYGAGRTLDVELGVAAQSRLEDDPWFWPYIGFRWRPTDALSFQARGTSLESRFEFATDWSVFARAEYELHQFRLSDDHPTAKGVFRDEQIRAGVGLARRAHNGLGFQIFGGVDVWRELSSFDRDGTRLAEVEPDSAPFVAIDLSLSF